MSEAARGVVITGAAGDLGRALCQRFLATRMTVFGADLAPQAASEAGHLVPVRVDVTDRQQMFDLAERAAAETRLEAWVNAAGIFVAGPVSGADEATWQRILAVNLGGTFHGCAAALQVLVRAGGGRIVNVWIGFRAGRRRRRASRLRRIEGRRARADQDLRAGRRGATECCATPSHRACSKEACRSNSATVRASGWSTPTRCAASDAWTKSLRYLLSSNT